MTTPHWRTLSIKVNKNRKAVAMQAKFPLTIDEWDTLLAKLDELKPELTEEVPCPLIR